VDPIEFEYNAIEIGDEDSAKLAEFASKIVDSAHLNVLIEAYANEREIAAMGGTDDPSALFDVLSARLDETRSILEDGGAGRLRMPTSRRGTTRTFSTTIRRSSIAISPGARPRSRT
jgi:hypothetical protein